MLNLRELLSRKSGGIFKPVQLALFTVVVGACYIIVSNIVIQTFAASYEEHFMTLITIRAFLLLLLASIPVAYIVRRYTKRIVKNDRCLAFMFDHNLTPMWIVDKASLKFVDVNEAGTKLFGYSKAEFLSMSMADISYADIPDVTSPLRTGSSTPGSVRFTKFKSRQGTPVYAESTKQVLETDTQLCELFILHDVTQYIETQKDLLSVNNSLEANAREQKTRVTSLVDQLAVKQMEADHKEQAFVEIDEKLRRTQAIIEEQASVIRGQRENRLNRILSTLNDIVWSFDLTDGNDHYLSPNSTAILNVSKDVLATDPLFWKQLVLTEDREIIEQSNIELKANGKTDFTCRFSLPGKGVRWCFVRAWLVKDEAGHTSRIEGICTDVTYVKQTEQMLLEQDLKLRSVFDSLDIALVLMDRQGTILLFNKVTEQVSKIWNVGIGEGQNLIALSPPGKRENLTSAFATILSSGKSISYVSEYIMNGSEIYLSVTIQPIFNVDGHVHQVCLMARDITERKAAEKQIRESADLIKVINERYRLASFVTNDAVWDWDLVTNQLFWGEGYQRLFGYDVQKEEAKISSWFTHIHPEDAARVQSSISDFISRNAQGSWEEEYRYARKDGTFARILDRGYFIRNDHGKPIRMIGAMQDITDRAAAVDEIKKLSLVASKTDNLVIITDHLERIEWVNEGFTRSTGYTLEEVVGKRPKDVLQGPETDRLALDRIRHCLDLKAPVSEEVLNYTKSGKKIWLKMSINPVLNDAGEVIKFISVETDVTIQRDYANSITAIAKDLSDLIKNAHAIIFGIDRNGYVYEWNKLTEIVTGYERDEVIERKLVNFLIDKEHRDKIQSALDHVLLGNPMGQYEFPIRNKSGEPLTLLVNATPRTSPSGDIAGLLVVGQDITELYEYRKSLEKKVKERTAELERALRNEKELVTLKSRFASMVSHEFRTPLSTIKLSVNYIKRYKDRMKPREIDEKIQVVQEQIAHMTHVLTDVLTLGKAEENKISLVTTDVDPVQLFSQIISEVENHYQSHKVIFSHTGLPSLLKTDTGLMRNIFINLLSNAMKFSPGENEVYFNMKLQDGCLHAQVMDKGIGIPEAEIGKIFDPFHRAENVSTIPGTGLGLSIVRKAVDLLNGSISLSPNGDKGTTFVITIPVCRND
jgi:PAS domain S-box-containing protein